MNYFPKERQVNSCNTIEASINMMLGKNEHYLYGTILRLYFSLVLWLYSGTSLNGLSIEQTISVKRTK